MVDGGNRRRARRIERRLRIGGRVEEGRTECREDGDKGKDI